LSRRRLDLCRRLKQDHEFQGLIQVGHFEESFDRTLAEILTCDDAELPKVRQALVICNDLKNYLDDTIKALEAEGVGQNP